MRARFARLAIGQTRAMHPGVAGRSVRNVAALVAAVEPADDRTGAMLICEGYPLVGPGRGRDTRSPSTHRVTIAVVALSANA